LKNIKVKTKMNFIILIMVCLAVVVNILSINNLNQLKNNAVASMDSITRADYDNSIKEQVRSVISLLDTIYQQYEDGVYSFEEAKKVAADLVREMRYGENGYFWVDYSDGTNVVLLGNETEGTNRMETKDAEGYQMVKEIIRIAVEDGGGYVDYVFPKEGETVSSPKRSYSQYYEPFDWVVGTGNYIDYLDDLIKKESADFSEYTSKKITILISSCIALLVVLTTLVILISNDIVKALKQLSLGIDRIAKGNFIQSIEQKLTLRKDDFGQLASELETMRISVKELLTQVKEETINIENLINTINTNSSTLNEQIEDVSATIQELAASTQETAASTEQITALSREMEDAAGKIAMKAQNGTEETEAIHQRAQHGKNNVENNQKKIASILYEIETGLKNAFEEIKAVKEIDTLTEAVLSIAAQTNLLALNASIEAARAGEAGKGFAVVADEIRVLAEQSKQAVSNIQSVIGLVNTSVQDLTDDSNKLLKFVNEDIMNSLGEFGEMADAYNSDASKINDLMANFSTASAKLRASINMVKESLDGISTASNDSAAGTTDMAQKAVEIAQESTEMLTGTEMAEQSAEKLKISVERFVIE